MNWKLKAAIQRLLSSAPGGQHANYGLQRLMRRSLEISDQGLQFRSRLAADHLRAALRVLGRPASAVTVYEFGGGAELVAPLTRYGLGVRTQLVIDQDPLLRLALVRSALRKLRSHQEELGIEALPVLETSSRQVLVRELAEKAGIRYLAPLDARSTGWGDASVDVVFSNSTLEHIARTDLVEILRECRRVLRPDAVMCHRVDYEDHYAILDRELSPYNFLRYSEREWRRYNSRLQFQNRLRHKDYIRLFVEAGFEIVSIEILEPSAQVLAKLSEMPVAPEFGAYTLAELGTRKGTFLLRNVSGAA